MLPLRKEFKLNLEVWDKTYNLEYLEATAEESSYFYSKTKTTSDFIVWFASFLDKQDSLNKYHIKNIMMFICEDIETNIKEIYNTITTTMFRSYESKYKNRRLPKEKGQWETVSCDAATELHLAQKTLIPVHKLNKKLTLYQRQRLLDWIICDSWNNTKNWQVENKKAWWEEKRREAVEYKESDEYKEKKAKMDRFKAALDKNDKKDG